MFLYNIYLTFRAFVPTILFFTSYTKHINLSYFCHFIHTSNI